MLRDLLAGGKVVLNGYNGAIINTGYEDLADSSTALVLQATAGLAIKVASSSVNDVMTSGSGAWKIRLYGLSPTGYFQTEDIELNGTTTVASTKTWGLAGGFPILGAEVIASGTGLVNAGNLCVVDNSVTVTAGVSQDMTKTYAIVTAGENQSHNGFFQVPMGQKYILSEVTISNRAQICDYSILIKEAATTAALSYRMPLVLMPATGIPFPQRYPRGTLFLPPTSIIRFQGKAATTGAIGAVTAILDRWF